MISRFFLGLLFSVALVGCGASVDSGDVSTAEKATAAAPKSGADLPDNMPPEARKSAEAAMGQQKAMQKQMDAQAAAMKQMRKDQ